MYYREDLDERECHCGAPACAEELTLHSKCHPDAPTWAAYFKGILTIKCSVCEKPLAQIAVANKPS